MLRDIASRTASVPNRRSAEWLAHCRPLPQIGPEKNPNRAFAESNMPTRQAGPKLLGEGQERMRMLYPNTSMNTAIHNGVNRGRGCVPSRRAGLQGTGNEWLRLGAHGEAALLLN